MGWGYNSITESNNTLYYNQAGSYTVFTLTPTAAKPNFSINFVDSWLWNDRNSSKDRNTALIAITTSTQIPAFKAYTSKENIYIEYASKQELKRALLDRTSGKNILLSPSGSNSMQFGLKAVGWDRNKILFTLETSDMEEFVKEVELRQIEVNSIPEISGENPILVWLTVKQPHLWGDE